MSFPIPSRVDVLIVGYGPVGAALGCLLGRYGVTTLIVDKADDILMAPRAIALDNEALRILQMAGLAHDAFDKVAIPNVRMHSPYVGEFARINTTGSIDGHPKLVTFYQPDLERALRRQIATHGCVTARGGIEMTHFVDTGDGVQASLIGHDGQRMTVETRYLIGADGAGSAVRKAIGQAFSGQTYSEDWLIVDARMPPGTFDHVEFLCNPDRPTPHMVAPGGRIRWEFMLKPGETREQMESDATIQRLLAPWATTGELSIERKAVYRFHARSCARYSKGRVFLIGDAAHITPPFVGQGLVSGLRDAANLGWKLAWVLRGQASAKILDSYDRERRPHAAKMIRLAKFMGRMVMPSNAAVAIAIHGFMRLLRLIPGLRAFFEELGVKPQNRYPDGLFVKGRGRLPRGGMLPQGLVRDPGGACRPSDDALGPNLTLLGFGLDPDRHLDSATRADWQARGGRIAQISMSGEALYRGDNAFDELANTLLPGAAPYGWCAVIRPDRQIIHDGPIGDAARLVRESIAVLDGN
ncbi:MAG: bifunctional 3-(3-hydroxy-phenyl)propionate/3-hydroxycinnamic acid hydroxylase [Gammaproteobacteria bacterium]|nr:bifunctional 3-(3-hydroxy-phenyl)propionate/3-hydroxycinnamic acid hydroxylase [Gammaproteobacteria bacterium]